MLGLNPHWGNHGFTNSADLSPLLPQNPNEALSEVSQTKTSQKMGGKLKQSDKVELNCDANLV